MSISRTARLLAAALAAAVASTACFDDLRLAAYDLEIGPNPAVPGDPVMAVVSFWSRVTRSMEPLP